MIRPPIRFFRSIGLGIAMALLAGGAVVQAQTASNKPLVLKVAYPPGGPADVATRRLQAPLQAMLGQPVIVENVPGANGSIGASNVLNAPPDGQTLLVTTGNDMILAPLAIAQVRYKSDSYRLLAPIFPADFALVTNADHSFAGIDDLIEQGRKPRDKEFSFGSWGRGSAPCSRTSSTAPGLPCSFQRVPQPVAAKLSAQLGEVVKSDDFQRFLRESAALPVAPMTLPQAAAFYQTETDKFHRIAKAVKLEPQ